jgi:hypothetical protein
VPIGIQEVNNQQGTIKKSQYSISIIPPQSQLCHGCEFLHLARYHSVSSFPIIDYDYIDMASPMFDLVILDC